MIGNYIKSKNFGHKNRRIQYSQGHNLTAFMSY